MKYYNLFLSFIDENGVGSFRGMFSIDHLIFTILGFVALALLLYFSRNFTKEKVEKTVKIIFYVVAILEVLKIVWNLVFRTDKSMNNWVPLYFCSLFIYASGMFTYGKGVIKDTGILWTVYGQVIGGIVFLLYPSSSIGIHPLIHVLSIHSWIYHVLASYTGLLLLITGYYKIGDKLKTKKEFLIYFISVIIIEIIVYIFNLIFNTNLMFINNPGVVAPLELVVKVFGIFYPIIIGLAQAFFTYLGGYLLVKLVTKLKYKNGVIE